MILIILKNFLKGVFKIKKLCCILCTLLFLFLFAFSKPNIKANDIIYGADDVAVSLAYFAPSTISYNFIDLYSLVVPNDYRFDLQQSESDSVNTYMQTYYYRSGSNHFNTEINNTIVYRYALTNSYWADADSEDYLYQIISDFEAGPEVDSDLSIGYGFDNIACSGEFLKSAYNQSLPLYKVKLPFVNQSYTIDYVIHVTAPTNPFNYTNYRGDVVTGYNYDGINSFEGSTTLTFGSSVYTDLSPYVISSEFGSFISNLEDDDERNILLNVTYKIYVDSWLDMLVGPPIFYQSILSHPISDIQDYLKSSMGPHLPLELYNGYWLPRGSWGGDSSSFVPNLANSLLVGLQNFLSFELIPGFSLYHVLMLIVAIPLLIFILKLFLGG